MLTENLARVRARIRAACARAGRDPASITLVAVTKGMGVERMREAVALGLTDLGENRVQEAREKQLALSLEPIVRWHLIGHLQRNKVTQAVELFSVIHSVDSVELADTLERHLKKAQGAGRRAQEQNTRDVFVQVNVSREATKFGCAPDEAPVLAQQITTLSHLRLRGFMMIAPFTENSESVRPIFRQLRELRDSVACTLRLTPCALQLSMGMSGDFEVAIEEGADIIRIGTALFGTGDMRQGT